ncbi:MAG: hypothetical protein U1E52_00445 [Geminicoccaceae bacterium]
MRHLVLEDEVPDDLETLIAHLTAEVGATSEIEARLARRLAIAFWKGERAERIEVALFDAAPKLRPPVHGFEWEQGDPLTTFDVRRFNAIRGQQAQLGREIRNCRAELRALRKEALARTDEPGEPEAQNYTNDLSPCTFEPGECVRNEPEPHPTARHFRANDFEKPFQNNGQAEEWRRRTAGSGPRRTDHRPPHRVPDLLCAGPAGSVR